MSKRGQILLALALLPFTATLHGWALSVTWGWFIVPTFGAPPLRIPVAIGIAAVVAYMARDTDEDDRPLDKVIASAIVRPLILLSLCWIVRLFV